MEKNPRNEEHFFLDKKYTLKELLEKDKTELEKLRLIKEMSPAKKKKLSDYLRDGLVPLLVLIVSLTSTWAITAINMKTSRLADDKKYIRDLDKEIHRSEKYDQKLELLESMAIFDSAYEDESDDEIDLILKRNNALVVAYNSRKKDDDNLDSAVARVNVTSSVKLQLASVDAEESKINNEKLRADYHNITPNIGTSTALLDKKVKGIKALDSTARLTQSVEDKTIKQIKLLSNPSIVPVGASDDADIVWFKAGYYLTFYDSLMVSLNKIDEAQNEIMVSIYRMDPKSGDTLETIVENVTVQTEKSLSFAVKNHHYSIDLHTIGRAGRNPFTPAAYISFKRWQIPSKA